MKLRNGLRRSVARLKKPNHISLMDGIKGELWIPYL
jgi:hypothetical protein